jgi:hypothetical protein
MKRNESSKRNFRRKKGKTNQGIEKGKFNRKERVEKKNKKCEFHFFAKKSYQSLQDIYFENHTLPSLGCICNGQGLWHFRLT